ncbi:MAG: hypothetical protein FAF04_03065 [Epsilonproteobacteria bacterium]|nr:hypothetical protein [Campylobacterota bacterium]
MKQITKRIKKLSRLEYIVKKIRKYAYAETLILIGLFLTVGYAIDPQDICLTQEKVPYLLIILAVLTLFHGFESGFIAMTLISLSMWKFYEKFSYVDFLVYLMMVLIFSEFHYYWTKKIRELKIDDDYKASKLDELSKAFYSLKISHDQLEKNYVLKPMSIRSAIETIILHRDDDTAQNQDQHYRDFLTLLEKSFNLQSGLILYKVLYDGDKTLTTENTHISYGHTFENDNSFNVFDDYIVKHALDRKKPVFVSDEQKTPTLQEMEKSRFLAAIPTVYNDEVSVCLS